jgi:hypothetical protein
VYYPGESVRQEGIEVKVEHPTDLLLLQIEFPRKFWPDVSVKCVDQNGTEVALTPDAALQPDRVSGRYTLVVRRPVSIVMGSSGTFRKSLVKWRLAGRGLTIALAEG